MKKFFTLLFFIFSFSFCKAQWVTIPDANFVAWLQGAYPSCMNGNLMDTTCSALNNFSNILCYNQNISDLDGIQYLDHAKSLYCYGNVLTNIPPLPISFTYLDCSNNLLTILPDLPDSLVHFNCKQNYLTNLPDLPEMLNYLDCSGNLLTSLPVFHDSLIHIDCMNNQITSLPSLPNSLKYLSTGVNPLISLPNLPESLQVLDCEGSPIYSLPDLPNSLTKLVIEIDTNLTCLPTLPNSLVFFYYWGTGISCIPNTPPPFLTSLNCMPTIWTYPICDLFNTNGCPV